MAYKLHYSDYSTTDTGPPDPAAWVGPPGPMGPPGPQGVPGPMPAGAPFLPLSGGTVNPGPLVISKPNATGVFINPIGMYDPAGPATPSAWHANIESYLNVGTTGGSYSDATQHSIFGNTTIYGAQNSPAWGITSVVTFQGTGGTAHNIALTGYASRNTAGTQPTTTVATTLSAPGNVVQVANVAAVQCPYPMPILINGHPYTQIGVSGASGAGNITLVTPVSVADGTAGRTVQGNNNPQMWGANIAVRDYTGLPASGTNALIGIELDIGATGLDDTGVRSALSIIGGSAAVGIAAEFATGISLFGDADTTFKECVRINTKFSQSAFSTRLATQQSGACAIWLADGHTIAFDTAGVNTMGMASGALVITSGNFTVNGATALNGLHIVDATAPGGVTDLSKHIDLGYGTCGFNITARGVNYNTSAGASHVFVINAVDCLYINGSGISAPQVQTGSIGGPTWTTGSAVPSATMPVGSLYSRVGGAVGATLYVSRGAGTWAAVAGV